VQTGPPLSQAIAAVLHGLDGVQASPDVHGVQAPPPQTASSPQLVPSGTNPPVSLQTGPAVQERVPVWHAFAGVHVDPATQATHEPSSHTRSVPQLVPSASLPLSTHCGYPVLQVRTAVWQGLDDSQVAPATQLLQVPPPHTASGPQLVPSARTAPVSLHTGP
jgi:hypothetical protein